MFFNIQSTKQEDIFKHTPIPPVKHTHSDWAGKTDSCLDQTSPS